MTFLVDAFARWAKILLLCGVLLLTAGTVAYLDLRSVQQENTRRADIPNCTKVRGFNGETRWSPANCAPKPTRSLAAVAHGGILLGSLLLGVGIAAFIVERRNREDESREYYTFNEPADE